jgi:hypothetical protein
MTVFVYVNTSKQVGEPDHVKVFANIDAANDWFKENDPEGVAFEYERSLISSSLGFLDAEGTHLTRSLEAASIFLYGPRLLG